uniref:Cytochrome P450, family 2, subfamily Y, polypeptide 3 n=1 Tax=Nothobranchius furzeri TaxID=105023 RepID=A0A8C6LW79_NOTFU
MEVFTSLMVIGLISALLWLLHLRNTRHLPPGPFSLPLIGNLLQINNKAPFTSFVEFSKIYGPVMTLHLGWQRTVVLVGYDAVKEALVDQADDFTGRAPVPFLHRATRGFGLGISNGDRWRQLRRFSLTTLRDFGMGRKGMEEWIQEESQHLRACVRSFKAEPFDPSILLSRTVSNVVCCLVFGQRFTYEDKHFLNLLATIAEFVRFNSSPIGMVSTPIKRLQRVQNSAAGFLTNTSRRRHISPVLARLHWLPVKYRIQFKLQHFVFTSQEKDNPSTEFHYENLQATVLNLFVAGTETTSSTIRYALSVLIKYPHIQEKMQEEIDSVIGKHRSPSMEDRKSLPFSDAVIHEVQRFLDMVPFSLPHYTLKNISFRGYTIPKGTVIFPLLHSVLKEDKHWATPWSFNPQHFLDHNGNFKKNPAFLPFSAGKRACVGESLARMELFIFIVALLQDFTFSCSEGPDSINLMPEYGGFANVPRRYRIIATPR